MEHRARAGVQGHQTCSYKPEAFLEQCKRGKLRPAELKQIELEGRLVTRSDLILLNEVDRGMKRSDYHDVARELASALHMDYAYAIEFVEVDPVTLGINQVDQPQLEEELKADPKRYKGLHGSAILSRYPLQNVKVLRLPVCHDWYASEMKAVPAIEKLKRIGSEKAFLEAISQERRRGGRMAIVAELSVPEAPGGIVTVVNTHLEDKCKPDCRLRQMNYLLENLRDVKTTLLLAGDMNSTCADGSILSFSYLLKKKFRDPRFWGGQLVNYINPLNLYGLTAARYFRSYQDPTRHDLPVIANNREYRMFDTLRNARFNDGMRFDLAVTRNGL